MLLAAERDKVITFKKHVEDCCVLLYYVPSSVLMPAAKIGKTIN